jgi:hypothetical protein
VVVSETCPHANGATHANAILISNFFIFPPFVEMRQLLNVLCSQ